MLKEAKGPSLPAGPRPRVLTWPASTVFPVNKNSGGSAEDPQTWFPSHMPESPAGLLPFQRMLWHHLSRKEAAVQDVIPVWKLPPLPGLPLLGSLAPTVALLLCTLEPRRKSGALDGGISPWASGEQAAVFQAVLAPWGGVGDCLPCWLPDLGMAAGPAQLQDLKQAGILC